MKLNKTNLKKLNDISHLNSFLSKIKSINSSYINFEYFINDFEKYISNELNIPSKKLSFEDKVFEGIINRLDFLNDFKNLTLRIYLESQKKPKYFLILSKHINSYFNLFLRNRFEKTIVNFIYVYSFNIWIEDNENMDKTMAAIGNAFENIHKVKSLIQK